MGTLLVTAASVSVVADRAGASEVSPPSETGLSLGRADVAKGTEELIDGRELDISEALSEFTGRVAANSLYQDQVSVAR